MVAGSFATSGPKLKIVHDKSNKTIDGPEARRQVVAAALEEISRREAMVIRLQALDERVIVAALDTFQSARGAAEWLTAPAYALGGAVPIEVAQTPQGRERVLNVLTCIEHNKRSKSSIYRLIKSRKIPFRKIDHRLAFDPVAVSEHLDHSHQGASIDLFLAAHKKPRCRRIPNGAAAATDKNAAV